MADAGGASAQVRGLAELRRSLAALPRGVDRRVLASGCRAMARPVLVEAKRLVAQPGRGRGHATGETRDALAVRSADRGSRRAAGHVVITALRGLHRTLHLIEFGTGSRRTRAGADRGRAPAQPFLRPALASKAAEGIARFVPFAGKALERAARRAASRAAAPPR